MGSHSTDEKSRDQWVKRKMVYVRVGLCMNIKNNKMKEKINIKVIGKIEGATSVTQHTPAQLCLKMVRKIND